MFFPSLGCTTRIVGFRLEVRGRRTKEQLHGPRGAGEGREPESADDRYWFHVLPADDRHQRSDILPETHIREFRQRHQPRSVHDHCRRNPGGYARGTKHFVTRCSRA